MNSETKYKFVNIWGRLGIFGNDIQFLSEEFFSLKVGSFINQIGEGKETGTNRVDRFIEPIKYVGAIQITQFEYDEKMYAFELKHKRNGEKLYLLYGTTGLEVFAEEAYSNTNKGVYMRFYKPIFKTVKL